MIGRSPIASLPMYQRAELMGAHDRYWDLIRRGLSAAGVPSPRRLSQNAEVFSVWTDPGLVLSQTCGMPYRNSLHGRVALVATPDFGLDGCRPGYYRSVFVVRRDDRRPRVEDFASATFSYNQDHSQSGYAAAYHHTAALGFWFEQRHHSGGHLRSAEAVADGTADIAAIDAVSWRLIERFEPFASKLRVIDRTSESPGLPYISRLGADRPAIGQAVAAAITDLSDEDRVALGLRGIVDIPAEAYLRVENPPAEITTAL